MELRETFKPGMYEIRYAFHAPEFDPESTYIEFDGRRTGPWDYAPWGTERDGDCLLPCVTLSSSTGTEVTARVFIPREKELAERYFNGRVGFRVAEEGEVVLCLTPSLPVEWVSCEIVEITDFLDRGLSPDAIDNHCRFLLSDESLAILRRNWAPSECANILDDALDDCGRFGPPRSLADARYVTTRFLKTRHRYEDDVIFWGNYLAALSLRLLVLEREADAKQLVEWTMALTEVPIWGGSDDPKGRDHNNDLTADFHMFGLVLALNWHGERFTGEQRKRIREKIAYQAGEMLKWIVGCRSSWPGTLTQNHAYFGYQTLIFAGAVLFGDPEYPQAIDFLRIGSAAFKRFVRHLPSDGSYHEGMGYISFGLHGLVPSLFLLTQLTGKNCLPEHWFAAHFKAMNAITPADPGPGFYFDDGNGFFPCNLFVTLWAWKHAKDAATRENAAQLLIKYRRYYHVTGGEKYRFCIEFWQLLLAPAVCEMEKELPPEQVQSERYAMLKDSGFFRGALASNADVFFLTGPPHGFEQFRLDHHTYGYGHHHPDTGSVVLLDNGRWVLSDTGYAVCKSSSEHNVLLVGGRGQYNDNYVWMPPPPFDIKPQRAAVAAAEGSLAVANEFAWIYPAECGLASWVRKVTLLPDGTLLVEDSAGSRFPTVFSITWVSDYEWGEDGTNASGWQLDLPENARVELLTVRPSRRFIEGTPKIWHALRLHSPDDCVEWQVQSHFRKVGK